MNAKQKFMEEVAGKIEKVFSEAAEAEEGLDLNRIVVSFDFGLDSEEYFGFSAYPKDIESSQIVGLFYEITEMLLKAHKLDDLLRGSDHQTG